VPKGKIGALRSTGEVGGELVQGLLGGVSDYISRNWRTALGRAGLFRFRSAPVASQSKCSLQHDQNVRLATGSAFMLHRRPRYDSREGADRE
jgi:hypothetical protein